MTSLSREGWCMSDGVEKEEEDEEIKQEEKVEIEEEEVMEEEQ